jgi:hypothetical protein
MKPISQPVVPPQPAGEFYGIQELALFKQFTRDSYRAAFGVEAPGWDPSRLTKTWFDSTADTSHPENVSLYKIVARDSSGTWRVRQLVLPAIEAAAVNLPGAVPYPAYIVAPTNAMRTGPGSLTPQPLNPDYLSTHSQALALMFETGGTAVVEEPAMGGGFGIAYPPDEPRRLWQIVFRGTPVNAGLMLKNRNAAGVGSPGQWDLTKVEPVWISDPPAPTGLDDTRPAREMPIRDLLPNESLQTTLMGVSVVRTDLKQDAAKAQGQFTPEDRAMLLAVYQKVIGGGQARPQS